MLLGILGEGLDFILEKLQSWCFAEFTVKSPYYSGKTEGKFLLSTLACGKFQEQSRNWELLCNMHPARTQGNKERHDSGRMTTGSVRNNLHHSM